MRTTIIVVGLIALTLVGTVDLLTAEEISFSVFYAIPIAFTCWYGGLRTGAGFALGSCVMWYFAELKGGYRYHDHFVLFWNALVWFSFFLMTALLFHELRRRFSIERNAARTDAITGLRNSLAFAEQLKHDLAIAERARTAMSIAYLDVDNFKTINDTFGHPEGDRVLRAIGQILGDRTRQSDTVARLGGDEFAVILPATDIKGAEVIVSKLKESLSGVLAGGKQRVTCSIGVLAIENYPISAVDAIAAADALMYQAKVIGKNVTICRDFEQVRS